MSTNSAAGSKRKRPGVEPLSLEEKATEASSAGFGLVEASGGDNLEDNVTESRSGIYGGRRSIASRGTRRSVRSFVSSNSSRRRTVKSNGPTSVAKSTTSHRTSCSRSRMRRPTGLDSVSKRSTSVSRRRSMTPKPAVHIVCAIGENLARETCIASLDAGTPVSLQITKQGNGQTYGETLAYLEMLKPDEVILNEGRKNSPLAKKIVTLYDKTIGDNHSTGDGSTLDRNETKDVDHSSTVVKFVSRSFFDQTKGAQILQRVARMETYDPILVEEYILLSSSNAVLHYIQQTLGASFSKNCLDVIVNSGGKNRMSIDRSTLLQLELLTNMKTGKTKNSLVSCIDCTKTTVGSRLLRTNLMAPPCRSDTICARLDLVDTFLESEEYFYAVLDHLQNLPAVDKMLTDIALVPRKRWKAGRGEAPVSARLASKGISALVCVKSTLSALPALATVLSELLSLLEASPSARADEKSRCRTDDADSTFTGRSSLLIGLGGGPASVARPRRHHLLRAIIQALTQPQLAEIHERVSNIFTESTCYSRNSNAMRHQECFALKSNDNGMMDVLRQAFLANVDDIYKKADEYAEVHGIHVTVKYSTTRGYYLSIPSEAASRLPSVFIQPAKSGGHIFCTTEEVLSLNARSQDNVNDLLIMTHARIQEVLSDARSKYDALAALSDAIALLDLCHSFADKVTLSKLPWSRPVMVGETESSVGGITIRNGRYGIDVADSTLASSEGPQAIIPNDTYASGEKNFTIISGINGSGKTTYLKQIAVVVVLAHCGCYVPAEQASIPLRDRLCARMGTADDQENNISSFMLEMKEVGFICNNASSRSLVLLDELGRATSNEDGVAIAWAVSEFLLSKQSMTFFVTHYPQLCRLAGIYPTVQNQHLQASVSKDVEVGIQYTHKVCSGPCKAAPEYGVEMAPSCGWPMDVVSDARRTEAGLSGKLGTAEVCENPSIGTNGKLKSLVGLISNILHESPCNQDAKAKLQTVSDQDPNLDMSEVRRILDIVDEGAGGGAYQCTGEQSNPHDSGTKENNGPDDATTVSRGAAVRRSSTVLETWEGDESSLASEESMSTSASSLTGDSSITEMSSASDDSNSKS